MCQQKGARAAHRGVWTIGAYAGLDMATLQKHELHLDVSTPKRHLLHQDVSIKQGPELHLDVSGQREPVLV